MTLDHGPGSVVEDDSGAVSDEFVYTPEEEGAEGNPVPVPVVKIVLVERPVDHGSVPVARAELKEVPLP